MYLKNAHKNIRDNLPTSGLINCRALARQLKLCVGTVIYQLKRIECVGRLKKGLHKHQYFIKNRIDKWLLLKLQRIGRFARRLNKQFKHLLGCKSLNKVERLKVFMSAYKIEKGVYPAG